MEYEVSVDIDARPESVWAVLTEVEHWPQWTPTMTRVERLDNGPLRVGSTARVKQPRLRVAVWRVTELTPQRSFSWTATVGGVRSVGVHRLHVNPDGRVTVTLGIRQTGLLAPLVGLLAGGMTRRYVQLEALGLKRRCEEG